ncbi:hypothetical protein PPMP20_02940 [Paraburkholderia phymatum]|uniref:Uncharacterized protein n=1 Tax=Paraburkholderia phymatum (strain DSM 17167 / CIP 108236 / LMG 21445 / STM815) TaxID=391038 RepID=B2JWR6_PARP8|nr:hypothetical protein [Paraburkholderia phymatum]ACC75393.1 hypothetical protein Bphy_6362 [Paraburkholderia phymatum STM815]
MSPDPISTPTSLNSSPPPEPPSSREGSSATSTAERGNHELMAALKRTLAQLGIDGSTGLAIGDSTDDGTWLHKRVNATSASLIAALYQALKLHQAIASANGATDGDESNGAIGGVAGAQHSTLHGSEYRDLSAQIADLAKLAGPVSDDGPGQDEWDWGFPDPVDTFATDTSSDESDPMTSAIAQLHLALQDHVETLAQDTGGSVPLAAVLDGLSKETKSIKWRPLGALIDVQA